MYYTLISFMLEPYPFEGLVWFQVKWSSRSMALLETECQITTLPNAVVHTCVYEE
jgi:hypothetical protein